MARIRTAELRRGRGLIVMTVILAALAAWMARHLYQVADPDPASNFTLNVIWTVTFVSILWTTVLAILERPKTITERQSRALKQLQIAVLIPAYNEDEALLRNCLSSLTRQTWRPNVIEVVDDGSTGNYPAVRSWWVAVRDQYPDITLHWTRTANQGKRHAQAVGIRNNPEADIYLTLDSDTVLDPKAIEEGMKPFADPAVQSVAGLCLPLNVQDNLLTRFTGLWETIWQLIERSAQSTMNSVTVNSGILAFYRGHTIRRYLDSYLAETFFGRPVKFSDDSLMTLYCLLHGKTVQQTTSLAFSAVPNKYSHHIRRYIRWMRGSFIRSWWRFKYLPVDSYIYYLHLFRWMQFALSTVALGYIITHGLLLNRQMLPYFLGVPLVLSYLQSLRYLVVRRNDESRWQQFLTFLTAPIAMLWLLTVMRVVKWYAYATVLKTGWGTRKKVEVGMGTSS